MRDPGRTAESGQEWGRQELCQHSHSEVAWAWEAGSKGPAPKTTKPAGFSGVRDQSDMVMLILAHPHHLRKGNKNKRDCRFKFNIFKKSAHSAYFAETVFGKPCESFHFIDAS